MHKEVSIIVYQTIDGITRIEYKGYVIQIYGYDDGGNDIGICHFIICPDGHDVGEEFCLIKAMKRIDSVVNKKPLP